MYAARHFILLLQLSSQKTLKTSAYELAVLRASGLVAVVLFVLTVINIVWADVDDPCATAASESAAEPTKASSLDAGLSYLVEPSVFADEVLPQANPIFRWVILAGSGLTTAGIAAVTFVDNRKSHHRPPSPRSERRTETCSLRQTTWRLHSLCQPSAHCRSSSALGTSLAARSDEVYRQGSLLTCSLAERHKLALHAPAERQPGR